MKKIALVLSVIMLLTALVGCAAPTPAEQPAGNAAAPSTQAPAESNAAAEPAGDMKPLKIGALIPMTGNDKETGDMQRAAIEMALDQINKAGGVLGMPVEVEFIEAGSDQQAVITGMQKAVNTTGVSATIGSMMSQYVIAYSDIVKQSGIPSIALGSSVNIVKQQNPYMYMVRAHDGNSLATLARIAYNDLGVRKVSSIFMTNAAGQGQHDSFIETFKSLGGTIVEDLGYDNTTTSDFSPLVAKVANSDSDGLLCVSTSFADGILLNSTIGQYGLAMNIMGTPSNLGVDQTKVGDAMEGYQGVAEFALDNKMESTEQYAKDLASYYPNMTATLYDGSTYDAFRLICEAARLAGGTDPASIDSGLKLIKDMPGAISDLSYHDDNTFANTVYYVKIEGQQMVTQYNVSVHE